MPLVWDPCRGFSTPSNSPSGRSHTCARRMDGTVACWGQNEGGETGPPTGTMCVLRPADADAGQVANVVPCTTSPTPVANVTGATQVTSGVSHTCALVGGSVFCWGSNAQDQLGYATSAMCYQTSQQPDAGMGAPFPCSTSAQMVPGITNAIHIAAGGLQTCAALADGTISCWGHDDEGQLGDGMRTDRLAPAPVVTAAMVHFTLSVASLEGGFDHMAALGTDGTIYTWGNGDDGQIGNGMTQSSLAPFQVPGMTDVSSGALGWYHTCVISQAGVLRCWGNNSDSELGNNGMGMNGLTPIAPFW